MTLKLGYLDPSDCRRLRRQHEGGISVLALANTNNISRNRIVARIKAAGGNIRGRSEANRIRMKREGKQGRKLLTHAANIARRGSKATKQELFNKAAAKYRLIGHGEKELFESISKILPAETQRPCGKYNIDIAVGRTIAVELSNSGVLLRQRTRLKRRLKDLRNAGYMTIYVTFYWNRKDTIVGNLNDIIAFIQRAYRSPTLRRHDWMISCRSKRFTRSRNQMNQFTAIPTAVNYFNTISKIDWS